MSVNLLVTVPCPEAGRTTLIRIKVPTGAGVPRFAQVGNNTVFVPLEDLIAKHLDPALPRCGYRSEDEAGMIDRHYVTTIQRYVDDLARKTALMVHTGADPASAARGCGSGEDGKQLG
ncbi:MAG: hypothetical protein ACREXX_21670 [Gammaproteobacteria bacterium]